MRHAFHSKKIILFAALFAVVAIAAAWQFPQPKKGTSQAQNNSTADADTSEPGSDNNFVNMKNFEKSMEQLNVQMKNLNEQMKMINYEKIENQAELAMKNIDMEKITAQAEKYLEKAQLSVAEINTDQIMKQAMDEVKNINWQKMQEDIQTSMKKSQEEMASLHGKGFAEQLKELQQKLNEEEFGAPMKANINQATQEAKKAMDHVKMEMVQWKNFSAALQKDGLIDASKPYTVELKKGVLFINGKEQSKETTDKYKKYYGDKDNFTINMNEEKNEKKDNDEK